MPDTNELKKLKGGSQIDRMLHKLEFAFRYETYQNVSMEDLVQSDRHTDQFKTQVYTAGINYYIKGRETRLQANYMFVDDPSSGNPVLRICCGDRLTAIRRSRNPAVRH